MFCCWWTFRLSLFLANRNVSVIIPIHVFQYTGAKASISRNGNAGLWYVNVQLFCTVPSYYANLHSNWKSMRVSIVLHHHSIISHTVITRNYIIVLLANQLLSNSGHLLCSTLIPLPELAWPGNSQDSSNHRALICFLSLRECCSLMSSVMALVIPCLGFFVVVLDRMINLVPVTLFWPEVDHILLLFLNIYSNLSAFSVPLFLFFFPPWLNLPKAFELWCWRKLLRVPWATRKSNQSILKEISPEYSLKDWC